MGRKNSKSCVCPTEFLFSCASRSRASFLLTLKFFVKLSRSLSAGTMILCVTLNGHVKRPVRTCVHSCPPDVCYARDIQSTLLSWIMNARPLVVLNKIQLCCSLLAMRIFAPLCVCTNERCDFTSPGIIWRAHFTQVMRAHGSVSLSRYLHFMGIINRVFFALCREMTECWRSSVYIFIYILWQFL